jgi:hypothetical protein
MIFSNYYARYCTEGHARRVVDQVDNNFAIVFNLVRSRRQVVAIKQFISTGACDHTDRERERGAEHSSRALFTPKGAFTCRLFKPA